ncbi:MAG: zinc ribbon domain-containing protein [Pseudomonadota bacterium]
MEHKNWSCLKCGHRSFDTDTFRATGGRFAKIFDVQNKRFSTVSCERCGYTEIYRGDTSTLGNIFDFFTN